MLKEPALKYRILNEHKISVVSKCYGFALSCAANLGEFGERLSALRIAASLLFADLSVFAKQKSDRFRQTSPKYVINPKAKTKLVKVGAKCCLIWVYLL